MATADTANDREGEEGEGVNHTVQNIRDIVSVKLGGMRTEQRLKLRQQSSRHDPHFIITNKKHIGDMNENMNGPLTTSGKNLGLPSPY